MSEDKARKLSHARKRRGAARASITRMEENISKLEMKAELSAHEQLMVSQFIKKIENWDAEFKEHHQTILDLMEEEEEALEQEYAIFNDYDDKVTTFTLRLQQLQLMSRDKSSSASAANRTQRILKRIRYLESEIRSINDEVRRLSPGPELDVCLLHQLEESIASHGLELSEATRDVLTLDDDEEGLMEQCSTLKKALFNASLETKRLLHDHASSPKALAPTSMKLPKISVPAFDGNILNWTTFWDQFNVAIHSSTQLSDSQKLVYLREAVKDGPAKSVIEGLSQSSKSYAEAIDCLVQRYDRPRLVHQAHVRAIVDAPPLRDGNGRELRRLHDVANQHLRALKTLGSDPSGEFVTSLLELKFDRITMCEWQKSTNDQKNVPHYSKLLEFLDLQARASENTAQQGSKKAQGYPDKRSSTKQAYPTNVDPNCVVCKSNAHPLYNCKTFLAYPHSRKLSVAKDNRLCLNCLKPGHFIAHCPSSQKCKKCNKSHHTCLHISNKDPKPTTNTPPPSDGPPSEPIVVTNVSRSAIRRQVLLTTCQILVRGPDGSSSRARALLDSASAASFISERLVQRLHLPRQRYNVKISGIGDSPSRSTPRGIVNFDVTQVNGKGKSLNVDAIVISKITSSIPTQPVTLDPNWKHLLRIQLADPEFGKPGGIDVLLGADMFSLALLHGRRFGPPGTPSAMKTIFGWILTGATRPDEPRFDHQEQELCYFSSTTEETLLKRFWEVEDYNCKETVLSIDEREVVEHFKRTHQRDDGGRFVVPLPMKEGVPLLGESRSIAVRRFKALERSLTSKSQFENFAKVLNEYFEMEHAEPVPSSELSKPYDQVYYLPMHAVRKESSSTSKIRIVFDASAKTASGVSLNDQLLVGPTVHPSLIDVLLRFRRYKVALTTDVSRMYRAVVLPEYQRDLHRFVWREDPSQPLRDFRMTRLTFGVSASSFAANMAMKQNALDHIKMHPLAAQAVMDSFYVDDGLTGADSVGDAKKLQLELQQLFALGGFVLRKWKSSEPSVLADIPSHLLDQVATQEIVCVDAFTKVLGVEWDSISDTFRPMIPSYSPAKELTKRMLISDIARLYDVLGWCSPAIIKPKILLQRLWEEKLDWDEPVSQAISEVWNRWRNELSILRNHSIPRCYFKKEVNITITELHGFCDASELAYAGVIYLRSVDSNGAVHVSLVMAKTKVAPIKRLTIPRLELCGAVVLAKLISQVAKVLDIPTGRIYTWTDSLVVLGWLRGNPRRFKPFVGNRVSEIMDLVPPPCWKYVNTKTNPADCASRGLFPAELDRHDIWWHGPDWLYDPHSKWPLSPELSNQPSIPEEEKDSPIEQCFAIVQAEPPLPLLEKLSSYRKLRRVTAWIFRFIKNCRQRGSEKTLDALSIDELEGANDFWISQTQLTNFGEEINTIKRGKTLPKSSKLLPFHPFVDTKGLLRVGGRISEAKLHHSKRHPILLPGDNRFVRLMITYEHQRLLHAGPTLLSASLSRTYYILRGRGVIRNIVRQCVTCRRVAARPKPHLLGQLPADRTNPGPVFYRVGIDYAGPILIKHGPIRKPVVTKAYVAVFVCFSVKAVHLEAVSELTTSAFIATLRRFIARRGTPTVIWSDHGTNFCGAAKEIQELLRAGEVSEFCTNNKIEWSFIPEHAPHFGGLWEAAVKSFKAHLRRVVGETKLTFEELTTVLAQIEACLNSRPLTPLPEASDGLDVLTPGHFLIGRPITSLPDLPNSYPSTSLLHRWNLCQTLARHFWHRWSSEYLCTLLKFSKWQTPTRDLKIGDIVCVRDEPTAPTKWPLARVIQTCPGPDGKVRVITLRTARGTYTRPAIKVVPLVYKD